MIHEEVLKQIARSCESHADDPHDMLLATSLLFKYKDKEQRQHGNYVSIDGQDIINLTRELKKRFPDEVPFSPNRNTDPTPADAIPDFKSSFEARRHYAKKGL